jgi:hypothetical protein
VGSEEGEMPKFLNQGIDSDGNPQAELHIFEEVYAEVLQRWLPEKDLDTKVKWLKHYLFVDPALNLLEDGFLEGKGNVEAALFRLSEIQIAGRPGPQLL